MNGNEMHEEQISKERRAIIIFLAVVAAYFAVCGIIYALTDINERNAYVIAEPLPTEADAVPEEEKINLNTATLDDFKTLKGIGDITAQKIIEYREKYGDFLTLDELTEVDGIGEATLKKLLPYITI